MGDLLPDDTATVKVVARVAGDRPAVTPGANDHHLTVEKVERHVGMPAGTEATEELECPNGAIMADGMTRVDAVDQGTGTLGSVDVLESRSSGTGKFRFRLKNNASGQAQVKLFGLCVPARTVSADGHSHALRIGDPIAAQRTVAANTTERFELRCGAGQVAVAPGINLTGGAKGRITKNEPGENGRSRIVEVRTESAGEAEVSIRCLDRYVEAANGHTHELQLGEVVARVTAAPGLSEHTVSCADDAKGIVASWDLPPGVVLRGHDPRPKIRVFKLENTTGAPLEAMLDLTCMKDRTGPAVELVDLRNTATVSSATPDPDASNNSASATVAVERAAGTAPTTTGGDAPAFAPQAGPPASVRRAEPETETTPKTVADPKAVVLNPAGSVATVPVSCGSSKSCSGTVELVVDGKRIASGKFSKSGTAKVKLSARARKAIAKRKKVQVRVTVKGAKPTTKTLKVRPT